MGSIGVLPPLKDVYQQRDIGNPARDFGQLFFRLRRFDKDRVDAELGKGPRCVSIASSKPLTPRASVRAMMQKSGSLRVFSAACNFISISATRNHFFAVQVAAALGRDLIFDMDRRHAGPLELAHACARDSPRCRNRCRHRR